MVAFWGQISDERLSNVFRFEDHNFLTRIKIVLGEEYLKAQFKYQTNVDIATMFTAWCFELGVQKVRWLVMNSVKEEWRGGLESFLLMLRDGSGFACPNGVWLHLSKFRPPLPPYLIWSADSSKEVRRASAQIGLHGVEECIRSWEKQGIRRELAKWGPKDGKSTEEDSGSGLSSKRKRGHPRGSKKKMQNRTLWIGFPPEDHDDLDESADQREDEENNEGKGKEIAIASGL
ncbi:hypothetical protein SUGI_0336600 [Cryptomeria japonica]|nr:hypothetical protein SUGI_0336600 [Cryptomeria japonica]